MFYIGMRKYIYTYHVHVWICTYIYTYQYVRQYVGGFFRTIRYYGSFRLSHRGVQSVCLRFRTGEYLLYRNMTTCCVYFICIYVVFVHIYMYVYTYIKICICVYTYKYIHIYTYLCTYLCMGGYGACASTFGQLLTQMLHLKFFYIYLHIFMCTYKYI